MCDLACTVPHIYFTILALYKFVCMYVCMYVCFVELCVLCRKSRNTAAAVNFGSAFFVCRMEEDISVILCQLHKSDFEFNATISDIASQLDFCLARSNFLAKMV